MSNDQGVIIAKRGISLSKTYLVLGIALSMLGVLISGLPSFLSGLSIKGIPANSVGPGGLDISAALPLISVPLQVIAALLFSTPVLMLYVYDKNNGILEYLLSLGMTQGDIYTQYLKAALILTSSLVCLEVIANVAVGLIEGTAGTALLEVSGLVVVIAFPVVSFETLVMMSFSSLQKQRVGSNQPLGMVIGVFMVLPAYLVPVIVPSIALTVDLLLAGVIAALSVLTYLSSNRLISREKLLP